MYILYILYYTMHTIYTIHTVVWSWLRHYAKNRKVAGSILDEVIGILNLPNTSSHTMALGSTQPLRATRTRNLPGGKGRSAREADNFTAICEPIV
jgi:hypothetical protein